MHRQTSFYRSIVFGLWMVIAFALFAPAMLGQGRGGIITGRVADSSGAVLQGARVELQPRGIFLATNASGEFTFTNIPPGAYTVTISYVGFESVTQAISVGANPVEPINVLLKVKSQSEEIIVTAPRVHGEAEAINRTRNADNILQVIPADVITSLPNANIADALGRLPSVTLERDEGEGKYVQIRGTEPRLTNVTIDGINVPSPESGVRQIKLDTLASDLVESAEINKTLQANQDGDGIGGSVNLKTKTAGDVPTLSLYGLGGYTPIIGGRGVDQFGGTIGHRFGQSKKLGILFGGTYDWNGRGINDIEPVPTVSSIAPHYDSMDQRDYIYYRTRWGLAGSVDYKLGEGSGIYLRGLYSTFRNWGNKWVYTLNDGANPQASQDWRRPDFAIGSLVLGAKHVFHNSWFTWDASVARSRSLNGDGGANFTWNGPDLSGTCVNVANAKTQFRPLFSAGCFVPGAADSTDIRNYTLSSFALPPTGLSAQLNLQGSASFAQQYHLGSHYAIFEFGGKIRNAHKFDDTQGLSADFTTLPTLIPAGQFLGTFTDSNYYDKTYHFTNTPNYEMVRAFALASGLVSAQGINGNNYNLIERVSAGYLMNTIDLTNRFRLVTGVRFEATHVATLSFNNGQDANGNPVPNAVNVPGGSDYIDVLPSVSVRFGLTKDSAIRAVFSRGIARPDPQDIAQANGVLDTTQTPNAITLGNPNLKAEHSNNYDLLFEQFLNPFGMIQAGFFYKQLGDPIVNGQFAENPSLFQNQPLPPTSPYVLVSQVQNIGSAHLWGFEVGYSQRLSRLPGVMKGLGLSANYSYTNSTTDGLQGLFRDDHPALLRQAPNTWNISPTFDTNKFSLRVGMTYNDAMIFAYQFKDLQPGPNGIIPLPPCTTICDGSAEVTAGGAKGPGGDNYLYAHYQLDAQASYKITRSFTVYGYGLNLNNEVFGFYNGSPQYVVQREYYHPTYAAGIRYTLSREK
ncbi:MAG TPA: TonB-dependent receptor [Candidatus Angelobacter sp.]|nr:TonB-dependent receptor [Candidatus Angelobacter sp.]